MSIEAIKEALDSMCRETSMHDSEWNYRIGDVNEWGTQCWEIDADRVQELATAYGETTAAFIAACNPSTIRSLIERLEIAEKAAAEMKWRPIETAPKDGTHILLTDGEEIAQGWWLHEDPYVREVRDAAGVYLGQRKYEGFDGWVEYGSGHLPDPTHWMPLPPSPTTPQEDAHESS